MGPAREAVRPGVHDRSGSWGRRGVAASGDDRQGTRSGAAPRACASRDACHAATSSFSSWGLPWRRRSVAKAEIAESLTTFSEGLDSFGSVRPTSDVTERAKPVPRREVRKRRWYPCASSSQAVFEPLERGPTRVLRLVLVLMRVLVQILAANRAQPGAVRAVKDLLRELARDRVARPVREE